MYAVLDGAQAIDFQLPPTRPLFQLERAECLKACEEVSWPVQTVRERDLGLGPLNGGLNAGCRTCKAACMS